MPKIMNFMKFSWFSWNFPFSVEFYEIPFYFWLKKHDFAPVRLTAADVVKTNGILYILGGPGRHGLSFWEKVRFLWNSWKMQKHWRIMKFPLSQWTREISWNSWHCQNTNISEGISRFWSPRIHKMQWFPWNSWNSWKLLNFVNPGAPNPWYS